MTDRLTAARDYVARKPTDRFGLYALAMELRKVASWPECYAAFDALLAHHPDYGAAYYHYGQARREGGDLPAALDVWRKGLAACRRSSDGKTLAELEEAIEEFGG